MELLEWYQQEVFLLFIYFVTLLMLLSSLAGLLYFILRMREDTFAKQIVNTQAGISSGEDLSLDWFSKMAFSVPDGNSTLICLLIYFLTYFLTCLLTYLPTSCLFAYLVACILRTIYYFFCGWVGGCGK